MLRSRDLCASIECQGDTLRRASACSMGDTLRRPLDSILRADSYESALVSRADSYESAHGGADYEDPPECNVIAHGQTRRTGSEPLDLDSSSLEIQSSLNLNSLGLEAMVPTPSHGCEWCHQWVLRNTERATAVACG